MLTLDAKLKVAAQSTTVEVKSTAPLLDRNSAEMASLAGGAAIADVALDNRNWANPLVLARGLVDDGCGDERTMYCWQLIGSGVGIECCKWREVTCVNSLFA
jgi:hypothetical protein